MREISNIEPESSSPIELDVRGEVSSARAPWDGDDDAGRALVQPVGGHDDARTPTRLFAPNRLPEVGQPDLGSCRAHREWSRRAGLSEARSASIYPGGRVGPEGREARVELIEEDASFERLRR